MAGKRRSAIKRKGETSEHRFDIAVTASVILCVMAAAAAAVGGHIYENRGRSEALQVDMIIEETESLRAAETGVSNIAGGENGSLTIGNAANENAVRVSANRTAEMSETMLSDMPAADTEAVISEDDDRGLVNINTASAKELESLDGIGEKLAEAIIEYRNVKPFDTIEEIMQVKGIGEGKFERIKDSIAC